MKTFRAGKREAWRAWLAKNHASEREVWVVFPKKHTGEKCMSYEDSAEEALCYGWIDSLIKRMDDDTYARKFTPRTDNANWSAVNRRRVAKCIKEGRMTEFGMTKIHFNNPPKGPPKIPKVIPVPPFMEKALRANPPAWKNFNALPPSHRRSYTGWITFAKQEETRKRRLDEAIRMLMKNERLGLK